MQKDQDTIYAINHYNFFDKIVFKKRLEISNKINDLHDLKNFGFWGFFVFEAHYRVKSD